MLLLFGIGVGLILFCAARVMHRHKSQRYAVLLVASALPVTCLEQALYTFAQRCTADCRCWYVYLPQNCRSISLLARRWGFSLLSAGECCRLQQNKEYQFYFLSAAGILYRLGAVPEVDWQQLFII